MEKIGIDIKSTKAYAYSYLQVFQIKFLANKSNVTIRMALDAYMYKFKKK